LEWWWLISENRCDGNAHSQEEGYNEALKAFLKKERIPKTLDIQKPNPRKMSAKIHVGSIWVS
jgi:hypothetical protein